MNVLLTVDVRMPDDWVLIVLVVEDNPKEKGR